MKDRYLFRGKRTDNGEWVYGLLGRYNADYENANIIDEFECLVPVKTETVGQYTGLTDKNGKMIFEGDVVAGSLIWQEKRKNGLVAFKDGSFGLIWYRGGVEQFNAFTSMCNVEYEIIGNIYDNPDLLKGE